MSWLLANYKVVLEVASYVVAGASAGAALLAPLTANKADDEVASVLGKAVGYLHKLLSLLALNPKAK